MPERAAGYAVKIRGQGTKAQRDAIARARTRLAAGMEYRRNTREELWERSEFQYSGNQWNYAGISALDATAQDLIVVNMSWSTVNTIVPYVTGSEPNFLVTPSGHGATPRNAAIQQAFINRVWRSTEVAGQENLETATVDALIYGDGYLKVGYDIVEKRVGGEERTYADVAELWVARVDPWDLWLDPTSNGIHDARWVCQRLRMTREELEASGYSNIDDENVLYGPYHRLDADGARENRLGLREAMDGEDYAVLYEFHDVVNGLKIVFADGPAPLQVVEDVPVVPVVQMGSYRIPNCPYHVGELEQIYSIQVELNKTRTQMMVHRARGAQKYLARKGTIDGDAAEALKSQEVGAVVEVDSNGEDLTNFLQPLNLQPLMADVYNVSQILEEDIYEISGVNEYLRGSTPNIRRTATEATIIEGASNSKSQYKLRIVERATRKVGTLMLGFAADVFPQTDYEEMQLYLTGRDAELVRRYSDPSEVVDDATGLPIEDGQPVSVTVSPSPDIWEGTYEVLVETSSTELRSPVVREQKYRGLVMDLLGAQPLLAEMGVVMDMKKLIALWLEATGIEDVDGLFLSGSQPQAPMAPQAEEATTEGLTEDDLAALMADVEAQASGFGGQDIVQSGAPDVFMAPEGLDETNTGILPALV